MCCSISWSTCWRPSSTRACATRAEAMSMITLARNAGHAFGDNRVTLVAACILVLLVAIAVIGPSIVPFDQLDPDATLKLARPSLVHPFGTDALGRDIL